MLGAYPRASRSRGSPASRAMPWVVATAASISSISASSVARGFADSPGMPAKRRRAARSVRRTARSGGVPADPWRRASWNSRSVSRPASAFARSRSKAVAQVRVRQPVLDPRERLRVGQLGDEALRAAREPGPVELADPVVHREVAVELRVLQAEARGGVVVHVRVPERTVELLVAYLGEQRRHADVRDLHVLEMALQHEGDLHGALGGARRAAHGRRLAHFARARQGGARRRRRPGAESIFEDTLC